MSLTSIIHHLIFSNWAPLAAAFITGILALLQIRRNNVTQARIDWLQNLKSLISDFLIHGFDIIFDLKTIKTMTEGFNMVKAEAEAKKLELNNNLYSTQMSKKLEEISESLSKLGLSLNLILLNLNPFEKYHSNLEILLREFQSLVVEYNNEKDPDKKNKLNESSKKVEEKIVLLSRYIFKLEWEKTKGITLFKWRKLNKIKKVASKIV